MKKRKWTIFDTKMDEICGDLNLMSDVLLEIIKAHRDVIMNYDPGNDRAFRWGYRPGGNANLNVEKIINSVREGFVMKYPDSYLDKLRDLFTLLENMTYTTMLINKSKVCINVLGATFTYEDNEIRYPFFHLCLASRYFSDRMGDIPHRIETVEIENGFSVRCYAD